MIASEASQPLAIDDFTDLLKKTGYAWVRGEIDVGKPLMPNILIQEKNGPFWQQFIYENLLFVCFRCERIGHLDEACQFPNDSPSTSYRGLTIQPENLVATRVEAAMEGPTLLMEERRTGLGGGRPKLGPWLVTSQIRQPRTPRSPMKGHRA